MLDCCFLLLRCAPCRLCAMHCSCIILDKNWTQWNNQQSERKQIIISQREQCNVPVEITDSMLHLHNNGNALLWCQQERSDDVVTVDCQRFTIDRLTDWALGRYSSIPHRGCAALIFFLRPWEWPFISPWRGVGTAQQTIRPSAGFQLTFVIIYR